MHRVYGPNWTPAGHSMRKSPTVPGELIMSCLDRRCKIIMLQGKALLAARF